MKRIAHILNGTIINVSIARDNYTPDGITQMLEADALAAGLTYATRHEEPMPVIVSMTALRLTLIEMELEAPILAVIDAMSDAKQKAAALAWWQTAQTVRRNHPLVAQLAAALNKTDAEIDAIFSAAITLSATL